MRWLRKYLKAIIVIVATITELSKQCHAATTTDSAANVERNIFASDIFKAVAIDKQNENVVISPAAIQTSLALTYYGAKGQTAIEMQTGLRLGTTDAEAVVRRFGEFQQNFARNNNIRLATNIYINEKLEFKRKFKEIAQRNFDANIEKVDFHPPYNKRTAEHINKVNEEKTHSKIGNVIKPEQLNDRTEGVIVNGISFVAPWQKAFRPDKTTRSAFLTGGGQSIQVETMWTLNNFKYGEFRNLDAKVVELPYQNSDFAMLIILPNRNDGLRSLEQRLAGMNLMALIGNDLSSQKVEITLPKFGVAFGVDLEGPLKQLGVTTMFSRDGDFGNMYRMFVNHFINSANYNAYVEISETGTEQPLESGGLKNLFSRSKKFEANHPFVFAIRYKESIIFMGHIANYAYV